jgi:hypothetical protein
MMRITAMKHPAALAQYGWAQQAFYKACKTAKTNKANGLDGAKYPHKRKVYRTTVWKNTAIRLKDTRCTAECKAQKPPKGQPRPLRHADANSILLLSLANGLQPIEVSLPSHLAGLREDAFVEMRLVFNKASKRYEWHLVIDDSMTRVPSNPLQACMSWRVTWAKSIRSRSRTANKLKC